MVQARNTLYGWSAKRAGGRITITHDTGKVANVDKIEPHGAMGKIVATVADGREFYLDVPAAVSPPLGATENIGSIAAD
jgi:hypothetical protein